MRPWIGQLIESKSLDRWGGGRQLTAVLYWQITASFLRHPVFPPGLASRLFEVGSIG